MKKLMILVIAFVSCSAFADESCEVSKKVDGKLTFVTVPCATMKNEQLVKDEEGAKKSKCGKDFMALRVGMALNRFEQCNEALSYITDTVSKDGKIETYQSTFYMINAQGGHIVSYTKRRF